jgi:RNA polymerase sigma-70 factor (ECF subfamily)
MELRPEPEGVFPEILGSEITGLLSLMLLQQSRRAARTSPTGELILPENQDRSLWNRRQIAEGVTQQKPERQFLQERIRQLK